MNFAAPFGRTTNPVRTCFPAAFPDSERELSCLRLLDGNANHMAVLFHSLK
jgi:hypothetical protein